MLKRAAKAPSSLTFLGLCFAPRPGLLAENPNLLPPALRLLTPLQAGDSRPWQRQSRKSSDV